MSVPAAAGGLSAAGNIFQTISKVQARDVAAKSLEQEAMSAQYQAEMDEAASRRESAFAQGKGVATAAASGVSTKSGTPLLLELDRAKQAEIEALNIRRTGQQVAASKRFERRLQMRAVPYDIIGGFLGAGAGATQAYGASR